MSTRLKHWILLGVSGFVLLGSLFLPPIQQDPLYHRFANPESLSGIPHEINVLSNLLFAWVGLLGLYRLLVTRSLHILQEIYLAYLVFFLALVLIAAGSAYYHWAPDNQGLFWDRTPMTLGFMSFFTILLAERVSIRLARGLFPLLLMAGIASTLYWIYTENLGQGDLRPYALIQFLPLLLAPLILVMLRSPFTRGRDFWWILGCYGIAKIFEVFDHEILEWLQVLSGHNLKHGAAAVGGLVFLRHLQSRQAAGDG